MLHEGIFPITPIRVFKLFKYLNNAYDSVSYTWVIQGTFRLQTTLFHMKNLSFPYGQLVNSPYSEILMLFVLWQNMGQI